MAYEQMKRIVKWKTGHTQLSMVERFFAGGCAGALAQTIIYPMEVLKTRLALRKTGELKNGLGGLLTFVKRMKANEGIVCFYKV
jgi:solute carrier family 25 (mitochondrial phosphate transporter), member 23/24/25/41